MAKFNIMQYTEATGLSRILYLKKEDTQANRPSILVLDVVDDSGNVNSYYLWIDSNGKIRINNSLPSDQDSDGTVIADVPVKKSELGYKVVTVTVAAGATSGSSAADSEIAGGEILGVYPAGNQDQFVDNVVLNTDGSITVTLAAAATNDNTFKVVVLKP